AEDRWQWGAAGGGEVPRPALSNPEIPELQEIARPPAASAASVHSARSRAPRERADRMTQATSSRDWHLTRHARGGDRDLSEGARPNKCGVTIRQNRRRMWNQAAAPHSRR